MKSLLKNATVTFLLCMAGAQGAKAASDENATRDVDAADAALADGRKLTASFLAGDVAPVWARFSEQMRAVVGSPEGLEGFSKQVRDELGSEDEILDERVIEEGGLRIYRRVARWSGVPMPIAITWAVAPNGRIDGFQVGPAPPEDPAVSAAPEKPLPPGRLPDTPDVAARLQAFVENAGAAPGVIVGLADREGVRFVAWGDAGDGKAPDADTIFEAGSITKGLTGLLLARMAAAGDVDPGQPIGPMLPSGLDPSPELEALTLEMLATHRSGLPRLASGPEMQARMTSDNPYAGSTPGEIFADAVRVPAETIASGRGNYAYSNLGMALLGQLLARSANQSYETLLAERVFAPLELAPPVLAPGDTEGRRAVGHQAGKPATPWRLDAYAPTGGWQASARDLLELAQALLADEPGWVSDALRPRGAAGAPDIEIGLGWHHAKIDDRNVVWHNGGTAGSSSFLAMVPEEQLALAVLANGGGGVVDQLARGLLASGR
ncbi:serine hydrolase domain-containing protein [Wenzhouxiangella sp. XN24]|uniref:serine hydrolase domain-containing protein n=1 Tax=Wenzhouxiangella sp. XN24 TaxID=2713569 RepID=UPI0013EC3152|nr:serine hydrolase domain-containing protein [Wenzhouxiangella sp. XN24]NGX17599.1 beta-lactamase family protein [Wenzhouxiangella sp. XN24]